MIKIYRELISAGEKMLDDACIESPGHDAEALLCFLTGFDNPHLFLNRDSEASEEECERYFNLIGKRLAGEPLQYITGEQYFMGHRFAVNPSVLIPRPETELLTEKAIEHINACSETSGSSDLNVLDLCTGSGAIAVSIAKACPDVRITASDISDQALSIAKKNALELGVSNRIDFVKSDLFAAFRPDGCSLHSQDTNKLDFDLIITNPPYIKTGDLAGLQREVKDHEPLSALDGGSDGLEYYRRIAADAPDCLRGDGILLSEIGADQAEEVAGIFKAAGFSDVTIFQDLSGYDRIIEVR